MFEINNEITVNNYGDFLDAVNDLQRYIDADDSNLSDRQYNELARISDEFARWKPVLKVTNHYTGKEVEV